MSQSVMISDQLYARLEATARAHGLINVEQLLEAWQAREDQLVHRRQTVQQIDALRERLFHIYGEQPDSVELLREDRAR